MLAEYPSARDTLIERGKAHLRKDNLLDEDAAQNALLDQAAIPDKVVKIKENVDKLETRIARIIGEYKANMNALGSRLQVIEQLADEAASRSNTLQLIGIGTSVDEA